MVANPAIAHIFENEDSFASNMLANNTSDPVTSGYLQWVMTHSKYKKIELGGLFANPIDDVIATPYLTSLGLKIGYRTIDDTLVYSAISPAYAAYAATYGSYPGFDMFFELVPL
jgi:hypothetical protein